MNPPAPTCLLGRYPRFSSSEWRLPDFKARAALVRNLDFVLSRPDIAAAPLLGAEIDVDRVRVTDSVGIYGAIHTLGAFARYNRGRLEECEQCHSHLVASDGEFRFCPICGHNDVAFVYIGGDSDTSADCGGDAGKDDTAALGFATGLPSGP